ncbi:MAG: S8 family serine peptidase [Candidatus Omnitrophica bacterium]|nr:S8 family serine peptidase [Candidatus Omnitrophota bacterium]
MIWRLIRSRRVIFAGLALALSLAVPSFAGIPEFLPDYQSDPTIPVPPDAAAVMAKSKTAPFRIIVKVKSGKTTRDLTAFRAKNRKSTHRYKNTFSPKVDHQAHLNALRNERARYGRAKSSDPRVLDLDRRTRIKEALVARMTKREQRAGHGKKRKAPALEDVYIVEVPKTEDVGTVLKEYQSDLNVEYAQPDYEMKAFAYPATLPNDMAVNPSYDGMTWRTNTWGQGYADMWGLKIIKADKAWPFTQGAGVIVAVVDTGVDRNHPDLNGAMWVNTAETPGNEIDDDGNGFIDDYVGWDFAGASAAGGSAPDNDPSDGNGHGTHVSGTIAARANNGEGIAGVAPLATIMAVKGLDDSGNGYASGLAKAVRYAVDNGADVINCSWGGGASGVVTDAVHYAESQGVVVVAAAGNSAEDTVNVAPAGIDSVITVSASSQEDKICDFSNFGEKLDVSAPGGDSGYKPEGSTARDYSRANIVALRAAGTDVLKSGGLTHYPVTGDSVAKYTRALGTSMAAPHVSGVAALMLGMNPALNTDQVKSILQSTAVDVNDNGKDVSFGYGRVDARKACEEAAKTPIITAPVTGVFVKGTVNLLGTARDKFVVFWAPADDPGSRTSLFEGQAVTDGILGGVNTSGMPEGQVIITVVMEGADKEREVSVKVNVDNVSDAPVLDITDKAVVAGQENVFAIQASDPDDPATPQGTLTCSVTGLPGGAHFDPATKLVTWAPTLNDRRSYQILVTAADDAHQVSKTVFVTTVTLSEITMPAVNTSTSILRDGKVIWPAMTGDYTHLQSFDIRSGKAAQLTSANNDDFTPDADNGRVVFARRNSVQNNLSTADIFLRDAFGLEKQITNLNTHQTWPKLSGDKIAWMDLRYSDQSELQYDLYMYDLAKGEETPVSRNSFPQYMLSPLSGNNLVWFDRRNGNSDVFLYNMEDKSQRQMTYSLDDDILPQVVGDKIVWIRNSVSGSSIMLAQGVGSEQSLDKTSAVYASPSFSGDRIVWADGRDGKNYQIYMYDLARQVGFQLTQVDGKDHLYPKVMGSWVMWMEYAYNQNEYGNFLYKTTRLFEIQFAPRITAIYKTGSPRCATVTLAGLGFGGQEGNDSRVLLNGQAVPVEAWSDNRIVVGIPENASSGELLVETKGGISNGISWVAGGVCPADVAAPETTASGISDGWGGKQTIVLDAKDLNSGVAATYYSLDGSQPAILYTAPFTVNQEGAYVLKYYSRDIAGNLETEQTYPISIKVDLMPPTGAVTFSNVVANADGDMEVDLRFEAKDTGSGMGPGARMKFSTDNSTWTKPEPFLEKRHWVFEGGISGKNIYVMFSDVSGKWSDSYGCSIVGYFDQIPPVTTTMISKDWTNQPVVLNVFEDNSGVKKTLYSIDGSFPTVLYTGPIVPFDGIYRLRYYSEDKAGNVEAPQEAANLLKFDRTPPTGSVVIVNAVQGAGGNLDVDLQIYANDVVSGMGPEGQMKFSTDNKFWTVPESFAQTRDWTFNGEEGEKALYVAFTDRAGNWSSGYLARFMFDKTPPVTSATISQDWTNQPVVLNVFEASSGVKKTCYSTDGSFPALPYTKPIVLTDGIYRLRYYSEDKAGNVEAPQEAANLVKIDKTPPSGTLSINSNAATTDSLNVQLTLSVADTGGSGTGIGTKIRVWNNDGIATEMDFQSNFTWALKVWGPKTWVYVEIRDKAGNVTLLSDSIIFVGDKVPPVTTANIPEDWTNKGIFLTVTDDRCSAGLSSLTENMYSFYSTNGGRTYLRYFNSLPIRPSDGIYRLMYYSEDCFGNKEAVKTAERDLKVDRTPPAAGTISCWGKRNMQDYRVQLNLSATDAYSGVSQARYVVPNDASKNWLQPYQAAGIAAILPITAPNSLLISFLDKAGNESAQVSYVIADDNTAPITTVSNIPADGWARSADIELSSSDDESGVSAIYYSLNGEEPATVLTGSCPGAVCTGRILLRDEGIYNVKYLAIDHLGNTGRVGGLLPIKIDRTPPTGGSLVIGGLSDQGVLLTLTAEDSLSGVALMNFSNDGTIWSDPVPYAETKEWTLADGDGIKTVYAKFYDAAGNESPVASNTITVPVKQKIVKQRIAAHSGQTVNMTFGVPKDAVASKLFMTCDTGLMIGLGTVANICNRWQTLNLPPNTNQPMAFRVTNRTGRVLKAVPSFYIYKADRPNYANGVSGEITVNPNSGL